MNATLITGGAGFIGTSLVNRLAATTEDPLVVLDALTYAGDLTGIGPLLRSGRVTLVHADLLDADTVAQTLAGHSIRRVYHLAAESHVDRSIQGAGVFVNTNVVGTRVLLDACRAHFERHPHPTNRLVHVSTDEVFGDLGPDDAPFTAETPYRPSSPYAASKAAADHLVRAWHRTHGLPVVVTNCGNNYGPWQFPEKLVPLMILNAVDRMTLPVYGDGLQVRDWIHVEDHADALQRVGEHGETGATYLIGARCERSNIALVEQIADCVDAELGRPHGTARALMQHVTDRPGHDRRYALDASSIESLGWHPGHRVEDALPDLVGWYVKNRPWCERIRSGEYRDWYAAQYPELVRGDAADRVTREHIASPGAGP